MNNSAFISSKTSKWSFQYLHHWSSYCICKHLRLDMAHNLWLLGPQSISWNEYSSDTYPSVFILLNFEVQDFISNLFLPSQDIHALRGAWEREHPKLLTARVASVFVDRESEKRFLGRNMENSYHKDFFPPKVLGSKCNFTCLVICTCHWCSGLSIVGKRKTSVFAVTNNFETDEMHICLAFPLHLFKWRKGTRKRERINLKIPLSYEIYIIQ